MEYFVYVQASDGEPLMPTKRFGKVRRMLKDGRAIKVKLKPFTIRLQYEPKTKYVQKTAFGIDDKRANISEAAITHREKGYVPQEQSQGNVSKSE